MTNESESVLSIRYVKPEMIDLGAVVRIEGATCGATGASADDNCLNDGSTATYQCFSTGGSAEIST